MLKMFKQPGDGGEAMTHALVQLAYLAATVLFILSLHWMNDPQHGPARRAGGRGGDGSWRSWPPGFSRRSSTTSGSSWPSPLGFAVGVPLSRVPLTAVPQRTALSHAFGGLAAGLVGTAKYFLWASEGPEQLTTFRMTAIVAEVILGFLTFTGSLMAAGKLQEVKWIPSGR